MTGAASARLRLRVPLPAPLQPLNRPRYPLGVPKKERMTIAIGMLYDNGALLGADSLVTTGTLGSYESKILGYRIDGADVIFALAGNVDLADSAWQLCEPAVLKHAGKKSTAREIAASLRSVLAKEYKEQVIDCGYVGSQYDYSFLIAIRPEGSKAELYCTYSKALKKSRGGREHIGAGADLAKLLLSWIRPSLLSAEQLAELAAHAIARLKLEMPGVIGGNNLIVILSDDGEILFYRQADLELLTQYGRAYDVEARFLLWRFLDSSVDQTKFKESVDCFSRSVIDSRNEWKRERDRIVFSTPPPEADEAIIDLRTHR